MGSTDVCCARICARSRSFASSSWSRRAYLNRSSSSALRILFSSSGFSRAASSRCISSQRILRMRSSSGGLEGLEREDR